VQAEVLSIYKFYLNVFHKHIVCYVENYKKSCACDRHWHWRRWSLVNMHRHQWSRDTVNWS